MNRKVFVYGTLKVGGHFAANFNGVRLSSKKATILGTMFSIDGRFPGVVLEGDTIIQGEIHEYDQFKQVLQGLDSIEGYSVRGEKDHNLYNRSIITANAEDGEEVDVWVYTFNQATDGYDEVESGEWVI